MSSSKAFNINVKPRDVLVELKGVDPKAANAYFRFWMLHAMHREPLPPREEKIDRDEWDNWFRDKLDMKNVRGWIRARDELLRLAKIRQADDGRLYIGRTMRDVEKQRGGDLSKWSSDEDDSQGDLDLQGMHAAQLPKDAQAVVDNPVDDAGKRPGSTEVSPNFGETSADVRRKCRRKPLILLGSEPRSSYSQSKSLHELLQLPSLVAARASAGAWSLARDGPSACA